MISYSCSWIPTRIPNLFYQNGNYVGQRFTGYTLRQQFTVESTDVEAVENISREISALLAQGVQLESSQPDYYYSKLDDLKLELIEKSTVDAKARAEKIAAKSGAKLRKAQDRTHGRVSDNGGQYQ